VWSINADGTDLTRITDTPGFDFDPSWSPDGAHIVLSAPGLFVMNADGTGVTPLLTNVGETSLPDWTCSPA
jgi:Tol biopolymer transport system component